MHKSNGDINIILVFQFFNEVIPDVFLILYLIFKLLIVLRSAISLFIITYLNRCEADSNTLCVYIFLSKPPFPSPLPIAPLSYCELSRRLADKAKLSDYHMSEMMENALQDLKCESFLNPVKSRGSIPSKRQAID